MGGKGREEGREGGREGGSKGGLEREMTQKESRERQEGEQKINKKSFSSPSVLPNSNLRVKNISALSQTPLSVCL